MRVEQSGQLNPERFRSMQFGSQLPCHAVGQFFLTGHFAYSLVCMVVSLVGFLRMLSNDGVINLL